MPITRNSLASPLKPATPTRKDLPALEQLTADDYSQIDVRGGLLNRSQWLEYVKNRKSELAVETDDVRISNYGETSVVTGHWT
jgi:hypothetical protein